MTIGLVGRKCGMTRLFTEEGVSVPVTVIQVTPNRITQVKKKAVDGYDAIQITTGAVRASRINEPTKGRYAKVGVEPGRGLWEFRLDDEAGDSISVGAEFKVDLFKVGQKVDVTGITKGKGFAGTIKRWHFTMGDATHGNSLSHRAPGSIGQRQTPGRVFKNKKMAGHLGNTRRTIQSQEIIQVDPERHLLLVRGAVPGAPGGDVVIKPAVKKKKKERA